jgi:hypothetical protein
VDRALAAILSMTVGLAWLGGFLWFWWRYKAAAYRLTKRMRAQQQPGYRPGGLTWRREMWRYALSVEPDSPDTRSLRAGPRGMIVMLLLLIVAVIALRFVASSHAQP